MNKAIHHEHGRYHPVDFRPPKPDDNWPYHGYPKTPDNPMFGIKGPKHERHIYIRRDQVMFDIDSQLGMLAEARRNPDGTEDQTLTTATVKYEKMFHRWIDNHVGDAKRVMSSAILEKSIKTAMNNVKDREEVDITLFLPEWYDDTTFEQLCQAVHDYVVSATLVEYFTKRFTSKDPVTIDEIDKKATELGKVKILVNMSKPGSISKPYKPF